MPSKYKILEENKENPYLSNIQKSGVKVEFTIVEVWENIKALKKQMIEIESKVGIEKATMMNIIHSHPSIVKLMMGQVSLEIAIQELGKDYLITEKDRLAIDMFERSRRFVNGSEDKLLEFSLAIKDDERSLKEACDALKIAYPVDVEYHPAEKKEETKEEKVDKIINAEVKK